MKFYTLARIAVNLAFRFWFKVNIVGKENIPKQGNYIVCSNHSTVFDPVALSMTTDRQIYFMAKKQLFEVPVLGKILKWLDAIPVDRETADIRAIKQSIDVLRKGELFAMFPEGTRAKEIDLNHAKPGISMIGIKSKSQIIPVFIESEYKFRKPLNIEIKAPISFEAYYGKKLNTDEYKELSKIVLKRIYDIK